MQPLRGKKQYSTGRYAKFFLIGLSHDNLVNHYRTNFQLMHLYNYSLHEIDRMLPWEREVYLDMILNHLKEQQEQHK